MTRPLMATKLYVPRVRRRMVARPRLGERLQSGGESRLTLVSAPAGFGKTTLLAQWLTEATDESRAVAWLSLDSTDNEPSSFWTSVLAALRTAVPGVLSTAFEATASSLFPTELVVSTLVNDLAAAPDPIWVVLDDYHLVDSPEVRDGMTLLLEHLPPHVHVLLSTRADPDLPLARWRVRGELVEIRAADLRFTSDEALTYLNEVTGLHLPEADVETLEERTEGWIAALQLAALSLQGRDDVGGFIARFAGTDRYVVDYLVEEVLSQQPQPVREFLLHTSVLDRLTGPLCDAVTDRVDGRDMLTKVQRANLFLVDLDDERAWYRYHHLFADVLRARLLAEEPDLVPVLHQRASRWYEAQGSVEGAVRHALAARDHDRAAHLMELAAPAIRRHRQEAMLLGWLEELPDDVVRRSPVLSAFYAFMLMVSGDLDAVEARLDDAQRGLESAPDGATPPGPVFEELRTLPATIAVYRASLAQARGDVAGTAEHAGHALEQAGPGDHLSRGSAFGFLGLAAWARGDVTDALATFTQAVASLRAAGNLIDELSSTVLLADMWLAAGRPSRARRLYEAALRQSAAHGETVARATAELHVGLSEIDCEAGDLASAKEHLAAAAVFVGRGAVTEGRYRWFVAMGLVARAEADPEGAMIRLDQAEQLYQRGFFPDLRPIAAIKARVRIAEGQLSEAADWARDRGVSTRDAPTYLHEFEHLTLVRLLIAQHRAQPDTDALGQALSLLERLHESAEAAGRAGSFLEIGIMQALAHEARGDLLQAERALGRAVAEAPEPTAYVELFLAEGAPMVRLLRSVQDQGPVGEHARHVLGVQADRSAATSAPEELPRTLPVLPYGEMLSARELQVLRLLDSELSARQIAGELFVSHNTLRTHTKHIYSKLGVTTRRAAVRRAREHGLM